MVSRWRRWTHSQLVLVGHDASRRTTMIFSFLSFQHDAIEYGAQSSNKRKRHCIIIGETHFEGVPV
jgi:hypothetical protein